MPFCEIIYETGNKSVAYYDTEEEMQAALAEHQRRAINGEPATASSNLRTDLAPGETRIGSWVAERIKKVLTYDNHPDDYANDQILNTEELQKAFDAAMETSSMEGMVHAPTIAQAIRDTTSPIVADAGAQESQFKAKETGEVDLGFLKEVES